MFDMRGEGLEAIVTQVEAEPCPNVGHGSLGSKAELGYENGSLGSNHFVFLKPGLTQVPEPNMCNKHATSIDHGIPVPISLI